MKKMRFVLTLMFVLLTSSLVAQNRLLGAKFTFGPKVAFTMTELSFNKDFTSNFQSGFDAGLFFRFGSRFHFQPEIYYSFQDCSSFPNVISNLQENLAIKTHYLVLSLFQPILISRLICCACFHLFVPLSSFFSNSSLFSSLRCCPFFPGSLIA